jgi:hypothetical protein
MNKSATKAKVPAKQRDSKYFSATAKVRWDKEREKNTLKLAKKLEAILVKNSKLPTNEVSVLLAKASLSHKK